MKRFLPLIVVTALFALFLTMMLSDRNPREIKSVMIDRAAPAFALPELMTPESVLTSDLLKSGKPILVNFFASWCVPCRAEHESLMLLKDQYGLEIIGIAYKDDPAKSRAFLAELGDPYSVVVMDQSGRTGIDWGVTGVPETFVIDGDGIVRYRHWGPVLKGNGLESKLLPKVRGLQ